MVVDVRLACEKIRKVAFENEEHQELKTTDDLITATPGFMRGHGTYTEDEKLLASVAGIVVGYNKLVCVKTLKTRGHGTYTEDEKLLASVAGIVERYNKLVCVKPLKTRGHGTYTEDEKLLASVAGIVERYNKLVCVKPLKTRYNGEIGDVVVGRIISVGQHRWKVDTHSKFDSFLMLSSVNLPGGELRRRSEEDERMMRHYLSEGDDISAGVQNVFSDGSLSLHTRSLKYGKLGQGILVQVSPSLVKRRKTHFPNLPCGASLIIGNNGYIWISTTINENTDNTGGFEQNVEPISAADRAVIGRLSNCVMALAESHMTLYDTSIIYAYEESLKYTVKDLLKTEVKQEVADLSRQRLEQET